MGSLYPDDVDEFGADPLPGQSLAELHRTHHIDIPDAVEKIEKELGINARGTAFTVADRIARAEAAINAKEVRLASLEKRMPTVSEAPPVNPQVGQMWIPIGGT